MLYALDVDPHSLLPDEDSREYLQSLGCALVELDGSDEGEQTYAAWFARNDCVAALVRPDFYVFGTASTAAETQALVGRLRAALGQPDHREERLAS